MRISDWSSDVCSSDLRDDEREIATDGRELRQRPCTRNGAFAQRHEIDFERDHRMVQVQRTLQARMQLADPANRDAVAEAVGRPSPMAPGRTPGPGIQRGPCTRSDTSAYALQSVPTNLTPRPPHPPHD